MAETQIVLGSLPGVSFCGYTLHRVIQVRMKEKIWPDPLILEQVFR